MKRSLSFLALALLLLVRPVAAQPDTAEMKPVMVVCVSSYQRVLDDMNYVGQLLRDDIFPTRINAMLGILLDAKEVKVDDLPAIDRGRPFGSVVYTDGQRVVALNVLPLEGETDDLLAAIKPLAGDVELQDNGIYRIGSGFLAGYAKPESGWLYFGRSESDLAVLPDPLTAFADLPQTYDLGVRFDLKEVPEMQRALLVDQMRIAIESTAQQSSSQPEGLFTFRRELARLQSHLIDRALGESDLVIFGTKIDPERDGTVTDIHLTPTADSSFAEHVAELKGLKTRYGNTARTSSELNVLAALNMTGPLDTTAMATYLGVVNGYRDYVQELIENSDQVRSEEERATLKQLAGDLTDVVRATIEAGNLDVALRMTGTGNNRSLVFAGHVAATDKLQTVIDRIGELADGDPGFAAVQLNAHEHAGTPIHSFTLKPEPRSQEGQFARFFGGELRLLIATRDDNVWLAVGPDGQSLIEQAMELEETDVPPLNAAVRLSPMLQMAILMLNQPQLATFAPVITGQIGGVDLVNVTAQPTDDGKLHVHIETQAGAAKLGGILFGQLGPMMMNMMQSQR